MPSSTLPRTPRRIASTTVSISRPARQRFASPSVDAKVTDPAPDVALRPLGDPAQVVRRPAGHLFGGEEPFQESVVPLRRLAVDLARTAEPLQWWVAGAVRRNRSEVTTELQRVAHIGDEANVTTDHVVDIAGKERSSRAVGTNEACAGQHRRACEVEVVAGRSSIARLAAASTSGTSCHSSTNTGSGRLSRSSSGFAPAARAVALRSSRDRPRLCLSAVVLLPHPRAPTIIIAGSSACSVTRRACR